jgi:hypothetical protein
MNRCNVENSAHFIKLVHSFAILGEMVDHQKVNLPKIFSYSWVLNDVDIYKSSSMLIYFLQINYKREH